jgi:hypothetical protein
MVATLNRIEDGALLLRGVYLLENTFFFSKATRCLQSTKIDNGA